jgi:mono/diheme cytochrome c family protein
MTPVGRRLALTLLLLALFLLPACQQKMASQPSYRPDEPSSFFPDGRADRPLPTGTVARGHLRTDLALFTGRRDRRIRNWGLPSVEAAGGKGDNRSPEQMAALDAANHVDTFPFPITQKVMEHGRNRYLIYCVVCHDPQGDGRGKIVERGYTQPPSYHVERLRKAPVGHFFDVITNGYGSMPEYKQQIPVRDRWAIVSWIRVLQLSQHFPVSKLTDSMKEQWQNQNTGKEVPQ